MQSKMISNISVKGKIAPEGEQKSEITGVGVGKF